MMEGCRYTFYVETKSISTSKINSSSSDSTTGLVLLFSNTLEERCSRAAVMTPLETKKQYEGGCLTSNGRSFAIPPTFLSFLFSALQGEAHHLWNDSCSAESALCWQSIRPFNDSLSWKQKIHLLKGFRRLFNSRFIRHNLFDTVLMLLFSPLVAEDRRNYTNWQHSH